MEIAKARYPKQHNSITLAQIEEASVTEIERGQIIMFC
jgi:hypothetical protein